MNSLQLQSLLKTRYDRHIHVTSCETVASLHLSKILFLTHFSKYTVMCLFFIAMRRWQEVLWDFSRFDSLRFGSDQFNLGGLQWVSEFTHRHAYWSRCDACPINRRKNEKRSRTEQPMNTMRRRQTNSIKKINYIYVHNVHYLHDCCIYIFSFRSFIIFFSSSIYFNTNFFESKPNWSINFFEWEKSEREKEKIMQQKSVVHTKSIH